MKVEEMPILEQIEHSTAEPVAIEKKSTPVKEVSISRNEKIRALKDEIEDIQTKRNQAQVLRDGYGVPHESFTDDVQAALVAPLEEKQYMLRSMQQDKKKDRKTVFQKAAAVLAFITAGSVFGDKAIKEKQKEDGSTTDTVQVIKKQL